MPAPERGQATDLRSRAPTDLEGRPRAALFFCLRDSPFVEEEPGSPARLIWRRATESHDILPNTDPQGRETTREAVIQLRSGSIIYTFEPDEIPVMCAVCSSIFPSSVL